MPRLAPVGLLLFLFAGSAFADTIVLKNGRRITASNVVEEGDRVSYETPAGRLSIPRSIVARIEKNDFAPTASADRSEPPVEAPHIDVAEAFSGVASDIVHDGSVDSTAIGTLENDARSGDADAIAKVAAAHHAAAQYLLGKGDFDGAADHYRRALTFAPANVPLLLNLAIIDLRQSRFTDAMDPLEKARRVEPNSADVAKLMGWAYYGANKLDQAVAEWKRAQKIKPDADLAGALAKAERDKKEEESYREGETAHFSLKYYGGAAPDLARGILRTLEDHFRDLESQLDYTPRDQIGVILYTEQAFADVTRAPAWSGAINDGRIRVPVQGLTAVTGDLSRVLKHELTHSFVTQKTRGRCPSWLQEGLAQWMEGQRSRDAAASLLQIYDNKQAPSFGAMEGSWMGLSGDAASYAYAWSLAAVETLVRSGGMGDIERLLDHIAVDLSTEAALQASLRINYDDLADETAKYLRREYAR